MRRSLLVRLSALTLTVIGVSVAATAWLAWLVLDQGIHQANNQSRAEVSTVYQALLRYGATHKSWVGIGAVAASLGRSTHQQIELVSSSGRRLALAKIAGAALLPVGSPVAVVDPLHVDPGLFGSAPAGGIDPAAIGPMALTPNDRATLDTVAEKILECVASRGGTAQVRVQPSGRPLIVSSDSTLAAKCGAMLLQSTVLPDQEPVLEQLGVATDACLKAQGVKGADLQASMAWIPSVEPPTEPAAVETCIDNAWRGQLQGWVAPPAALYVTTSIRQQRALVLSAQNEQRIAEVAGAVLVVAIGATLLVGSRLVQPLRALTAAAHGVETHGFSEVPEVAGGDEIAHLTRAFNHMARTQARMEDQRKMAVSDIAHELRSPLANIRAWLEAARDGLADNDQTLVASLLEETMLLQRIVDDLQLLSLADAGHLRLACREVPLSPLLQQARSALSGSAAVVGVTLRLACPDVAVTVDPDRFRQVVQNLMSNAIRHSHPSGEVEVRAAVTDGMLRVDVVDHGSGIAPADLPRVFDRFWRAERSRTRTAGGSGLGLAIVKQLVEAHQGTVTVRSLPDVETVFSVLVPARGS